MKKWEDFVKFSSFFLFEKSVFRELEIVTEDRVERELVKDEIQIELEKFVAEVEGKPYSFNFCRYLFTCMNKEYDKIKFVRSF